MNDSSESAPHWKPVHAFLICISIGAMVLVCLGLVFFRRVGPDAEGRAFGFWLSSWTYLAVQSTLARLIWRRVVADPSTLRQMTETTLVAAGLLALISLLVIGGSG